MDSRTGYNISRGDFTIGAERVVEAERWFREREEFASRQMCPRCGATDPLPILWGEPATVPEQARVFLGGCLIPPAPVPDLACPSCRLVWVSELVDLRAMPSGPRCSPRQVEQALGDLASTSHRVPAHSWPSGLPSLDGPGLYSWWADGEGASDLSQGLGSSLAAGLIYAGCAGATSWPSGEPSDSTLRTRIGSEELGGTIGTAIFRLSLASILKGRIDAVAIGRQEMNPEAEKNLTGWMRTHLSVAVHAFPDADALAALELLVLPHIDPPLNLDGVLLDSAGRFRTRSRLRRLRGRFSDPAVST